MLRETAGSKVSGCCSSKNSKSSGCCINTMVIQLKLLCVLLICYCLLFVGCELRHLHHPHNHTHLSTNRHLCMNGEHTNGSWVYKPELNHARKSFYCCGLEKSEYLKNKEECGEGKMDATHFYWGSKKYLSVVGAGGCWCDAVYGNKTVHPREMYEWVPRACTLLPFNGSQFCTALGNRTILLVGDSTMQQTAATLMSMIVSYGGLCGDQVGYGRSDHLFFSLKGHLNLFQFVNETRPDICIINAGAHNHDTGDMYSVLENLKNRWGELLLSSPHTKYLWKTNNPGHVGCTDGMKGDNTEGPTVYQPDPSIEDEFQWNLHPVFDEIAKNYTSILNLTGVIDMSPLYQRSDAHWDCLHYCLPGPLNVFSSILLNMLVTGEV